MFDYQRRVVDEKAELDARLEKLVAFTISDLYLRVPSMEQERLNAQKHHMTAYSAILGARIAAFEENGDE